MCEIFSWYTNGAQHPNKPGGKVPNNMAKKRYGSKPNKLKAYGNCDLITYCWDEAIDPYLIVV